MSGRCLKLLRQGRGGRQIRSAAISSFSTFSSSPVATATTSSGNDGGFRRLCSLPLPYGGNLRGHPQYTHQPPLPLCQKRWRSGKMGHQVESLKEMAHRPEREAAQERRKKKKDRKAAKKAGGKKQQASETDGPGGGADTAGGDEDEDEDDIFFGDEDEDEEAGDGDGEPTLPDPVAVRSKMDAVVDRFSESLRSVRGAEPTADMFDDVMVQAYGAPTPLNAVAQVVIVSPTLAQVTCFDPSVARDVVKAVQLTLELNPQLEEGGAGNIKVPLPRISKEVREKLSRSVKKRAESCKKRLRGVRRKAMDAVKKGKDGKLAGVSKDDAFASGKEIEAASEAATERLKAVVAEKMDSIMAV
ncbi:unnamed protein product [Pseudo-nitzschia multistriata]|uniref:Ribosome recycling factor domain-containing protein n=1 Tax=Pseudo-nitzschia multistriata TaxID=183589 RepID=A0A448Z611_9STRA|nr:unnamed protein product [Pseudo-nitzschia multistriata]